MVHQLLEYIHDLSFLIVYEILERISSMYIHICMFHHHFVLGYAIIGIALQFRCVQVGYQLLAAIVSVIVSVGLAALTRRV